MTRRFTAAAGAALVAALFISGCSGLLPTANQQTVAGITDVEISFKDDCPLPAPEAGTGLALAGCLSHVRWRDGKESGEMSVAINLAQGTFAYRRGNTRAFEGHSLRAAVEQAVAAEVGDVGPVAIQAIADAILTALAR